MKAATLVFLLITALQSSAQDSTRGLIIKSNTRTEEIRGNTYAVIVGVDKYDTLPQLQFAVKDALLFRNFLMSPAGGNVPATNIQTYLDKQATTGDLEAGCIDWLNSKDIKAGDRVFFYLSGHGDKYNQSYFFCTFDSKLVTGPKNKKIDGNVDLADLRKYLLYYVEQRQAEVVLIIDACRASSPSDTFASKTAQKLAGIEESDIIRTKGFYNLYATSGGSVAYESRMIGGGHGFFTYYLVRGGLGAADITVMGNNDGKISIDEFASYPKKMVPPATEKHLNLRTGEGQTPEFSGLGAEKKLLFSVDPGFVQSIAGDNLYNTLIDEDKDLNALIISTKRSGIGNHDVAVTKLFNEFLDAVRKKHLVKEERSALSHYYELKRRFPGAELTDEARRMLAVELINFSKTVITLYLLGADTKLIQKKAQSNELNAGFYRDIVRESVADFTTAADHLQLAVDLLSRDHNIVQNLLPKLWFLKARSHFDGNRKAPLDSAIAWAERAVARDTAGTHLFHLLAMLHLKAGNAQRAESCFIKAMEGESLYNKVAVELGYQFFLLKKFDEASIYYRVRLNDHEQFAAGYNSLALSSLDKGNQHQAERFFKKALLSDPKSLYIRGNLAIFYQQKAEIANHDNNLLEAEYYHQRAVETLPTSAAVYINQGNFYNQPNVRQYAKARACYSKAVQAEPTNILVLHNFAILYYNQGVRNRNKLFLDTAISLSKRILTIDANHPFSNNARVRISNAERAAPKFQAAPLALSDELNEALIIDLRGEPLAVADKLLQVKQFRVADSLLSSQLAKSPNNADLRLALGALYAEMENFTVAASHYEAAYKIRFGNISIALRLADVYLRNNVPTKATKLLAPVQQAHPNNSEVVYTLGAAYQADGNYRAAEELYLNYHLDHPADTGILQSLYSIYLHLGNSAKAESMRRQIAMRVK